MTTVHLPKKLGLLNAISINMSNMVGTGPFITVPAILATMGGPQSLICWFVGAVIAIADGLVFAELGTTYPSSGGSYTYLRECFGRERLGRLGITAGGCCPRRSSRLPGAHHGPILEALRRGS